MAKASSSFSRACRAIFIIFAAGGLQLFIHPRELVERSSSSSPEAIFKSSFILASLSSDLHHPRRRRSSTLHSSSRACRAIFIILAGGDLQLFIHLRELVERSSSSSSQAIFNSSFIFASLSSDLHRRRRLHFSTLH